MIFVRKAIPYRNTCMFCKLFYDFLTNYEENVYAKVEANAAQ